MSDTVPQPDDPPNLPPAPSEGGASISPISTPTTAESNGSSSAKIGGIIGGVVGGVIAVVILVAILVPIQRRRRIRQRQNANHDPPYDSLKAKGLSEFGGLGAGHGFLMVNPERSYASPGDYDVGGLTPGFRDHKFASMRPMRYIHSVSTPDPLHSSNIPSLQASVIGQYNQSNDSFDPSAEHGVMHPKPPQDARTRASVTRDVQRSQTKLSKARRTKQRRSNLAPPTEPSSSAALASSRIPSPPPTLSAFPSTLERIKSCSSMALSDSADTMSVYSQLSMPHPNTIATQRHSGIRDQGPTLGAIAERLVKEADTGKEPLGDEESPALASKPSSGPQAPVSRPPRSPARPPPMSIKLSSSTSTSSTSATHGYVSSSYTSPPSDMSHPPHIVINSKGPDTIAISRILQARAEQRLVENAFGHGHLFHGPYSDDGMKSTRSTSSHDPGDASGTDGPSMLVSPRLDSAAPQSRRRTFSKGSVREAKPREDVEEDCYGKVICNPVSRTTDSKRNTTRDPAPTRLEAPRGGRAALTRPKHKHSQSTPSFPILPATTTACSPQGSPSNASNPNIMRPRKRSGGVRPRTTSASSIGPVPIKRSPSSVNLRIKPRRETSADSPSRRQAPSVGINSLPKTPNSMGSDLTPKATSQLALDSPTRNRQREDAVIDDDYDSDEDESRRRFASFSSGSGPESILLQPLPRSSPPYPLTGAFGMPEAPAMRSSESTYQYTVENIQAYLPRTPPLVTTPKKKNGQGRSRAERRL